MNRMTLALAGLAAVSTAGCQTAYENTADEIGTATIENRAGQQVGIARMYSLGGEVTMTASFNGLPDGTHAIHLHQTGNCSAQDFTSAGGHLNPGNNQHGTRNPQGAHLGDLPNFAVENGVGTVSTILRGTRDRIAPAIFDTDGTAIVVHESEDDYRTDPAGDAGSRIACGVVRRG
ncbi:superoxide dismutase family protein [Aurantiacibacter spongiae]|uniref:Superoxide dismutase [Cu-Zn] n=1 Tax=Aurantiacibacter spongiae TaxID=2488860 RepID=A0A3N5CUZ0_9SPHN|nr:superoxide dismutase family protein [Aurantiacibacter spongiae]RPF71270.1 superoxide dismutase family protein [Aurantiacibacter spongiae]